MSESTPVHQQVESVQPSSSNPTTAGAIATSNSTQISGSTKINSMADLRKKAPKLYNMMLEGIAMSMCGEMQRHQARLKELMRKAQRG